VVYAAGEFILIVADKYQCLAGTPTEGFNDVFYHLTVDVVKAVQWLVENQ
jgi:hypothetical protein